MICPELMLTSLLPPFVMSKLKETVSPGCAGAGFGPGTEPMLHTNGFSTVMIMGVPAALKVTPPFRYRLTLSDGIVLQTPPVAWYVAALTMAPVTSISGVNVIGPRVFSWNDGNVLMLEAPVYSKDGL